MTSSIKFLHIADLHLDRALSGGKLKLPYNKAQCRLREMREVLQRAVELGRNERIDVMLIAGDLWEEDNLTPDTVPFVMDILGGAGFPVVVAPGNHDYYSPASHFSEDIVAVRFNGYRWADNVYIFRNYDFTHISPAGLGDVSITGIAYRSNQPVTERRLAERIEPPDASIHLAVIHGSRDYHLPPGKTVTMPFSDAELLAQPFDYTALGHYHIRSTITDEKGRIRAAYPGSTFAATIDDVGRRGCYIGVASPGGVEPGRLEFHPLDHREIIRMSINIGGAGHVQAVEERIRQHLSGGEEATPDDLLYIELTGSFPGGSRINFADDFLNDRYFHAEINTSRVQPEWALEDGISAHPNTTEAMFCSKLKDLIEEAKAGDRQEEVIRLQNVLCYGLDALHGRPILQRQVD